MAEDSRHGRSLASASCSTTCARARSRPTTPSPACAGCPFADLGFARVDHHRALRQGLPEAVYGPGKTPEQCAAIVAELLAEPAAGRCLLTRVDDAQAAAATGRATPAAYAHRADPRVAPPPVRDGPGRRPHRRHRRPAGRRRVRRHPRRPRLPSRCCSPTAAWPACTACWRPSTTSPTADAIVVIAGMEGALASLVGGITAGAGRRRADQRRLRRRPRGGHRAARHARRRARPGITVVGIDNGFGAACAVVRILPADTAGGERAT